MIEAINAIINENDAWQQEWRRKCEEHLHDAGRRCGSSYEVYLQIISKGITGDLYCLPEERREEAIAIAKEFDYQSPAEIADMNRANAEEGICEHGLDHWTCPCGCFEY